MLVAVSSWLSLGLMAKGKLFRVIKGTLTNSSGAVMAKATVAVLQADKGIRRAAVTRRYR